MLLQHFDTVTAMDVGLGCASANVSHGSISSPLSQPLLISVAPSGRSSAGVRSTDLPEDPQLHIAIAFNWFAGRDAGRVKDASINGSRRGSRLNHSRVVAV